MKNFSSQRHNYGDLKRLSKLVSQRRTDYSFLNQGGRIIYAVDSDAVKLFSAPKQMAVDRKARMGYCQFFNDSEQKTAQNLAIALSHYLFFTLSKTIPLLVFDGHLTEIDSICHGVTRNAERTRLINNARIDGSTTSTAHNLEEILKLAKNIDNKKSLSSDKEEQLISEFQSISEKIIKGLEYGKEIERLNSLLDEEKPKFAGIPYLLKHYSDTLDTEYFHSNNDIFYQSIIRSSIDNKLKKITPNKKIGLRNNDVSALYNLFFINKNMYNKGANTRLVLISGDDNIEQASNVLTSALQANMQSELKNHTHFSDLYIRHPLSFINDDDFIGDLDYESVKKNIMSLHNQDHSRKIDYEKLRNIKEFDKEFDDVASLFEVIPLDVVDNLTTEQFEERTNELATIFDTFLEKRLVNYSLELEEYGNSKIDKLLQQIRETSSGDETLRDLYNHANNLLVKETNAISISLQQEALARFELKNQYCYRIPPFLRFMKVPSAERYVKSWVFHENANNNNNIKQLYAEIQDDDSSDYIATLCNSAIWAYIDDWRLVQENASRAFKIAIDMIDDGKSEHHNIYLGHEAAYLIVVASRHLAKATQREDVSTLIENLRLLIDYAKFLWTEFGIKNSINDLDLAEEEFRFRHEYLSLDLMDVWYEIFYFGLEEEQQPNIEYLHNLMVEVKQKLLTIIQSTEDEIKIQEQEQEQEQEHRIDYLRYAQRHAINNFCMVFMVLNKHKLFLSDCQQDEIKYVLKIYHLTNRSKDKKRFKAKSYLHACTMLLANFLYLKTNTAEKKQMSTQLYTLLTDENIKDFSKKPYEKNRYLFYREMMGQ